MAANSKSEKMSQALTKVRDKVRDDTQGVIPSTADLAVAIAGLRETEFETFDPKIMMALLKEDGYESGERMAELKEGQMIIGFLVGTGTTEFERIDSNTKLIIKNIAATWQVRLDSGARVSILGASQLDRQLRPLPIDGTCHVVIGRGQEVETKKGFRMTEYYVISKLKARSHEDLLDDKPTVIDVGAS